MNGRCELTRDDIDIRHVHGAEVDDVGALLEGESEDVLLGGGAAEPVDADDVLLSWSLIKQARYADADGAVIRNLNYCMYSYLTKPRRSTSSTQRRTIEGTR